jgi:arylsulfatase A-like enzyme
MAKCAVTQVIGQSSLSAWQTLLLSAALSLSVVSLVGIPPAHSAPTQPNILIVVTDDERAVGGLGVEPTVRSWLKAGGTTFKHAYATTPFCCPSRASIITGLYAHNHGIMGAANIRSNLKAVDAMSVFPSFRSGGYRVGMYGKYLNSWGLDDDGSLNPNAWTPRGLDDYAILPGVNTWYKDMRADGSARWDVNGTAIRSRKYSTAFIRESALSFIEENDAADDPQPWLAYVAPIVPHAPATPEDTYANAPVPDWRLTPAQRENDRIDKPAWLRRIAPDDMTDIRAFRLRQLRTLMSVDHMMSDFRSKLVELGEEDNTIVIYTSDNGMAWGEHGRAGKLTPYLESVGVPLYIRGPGIQAGGVRHDMVALLDLAPTLLTAAGIPHPRDFDGHDVFDGHSRRRLLLEYDNAPGLTRVPSWRAVLASGTGSPAPAYEFIRYLRMDGRRLENEAYNLASDPWQLSNLHRSKVGQPTRSVELSKSLSKLITCQGATCARFEGR